MSEALKLGQLQSKSEVKERESLATFTDEIYSVSNTRPRPLLRFLTKKDEI